jgi:hypothetical protein
MVVVQVLTVEVAMVMVVVLLAVIMEKVVVEQEALAAQMDQVVHTILDIQIPIQWLVYMVEVVVVQELMAVGQLMEEGMEEMVQCV